MTDLCVSCNLCCNGSIFARVPIDRQEQERMPEGIDLFSLEGKLRMPLPCPKLGADGACTCYAQRPAVCRTYNCKLSKRCNDGAVAFEDATEIVNEIKQCQRRAIALAAQAMGQGARDFDGLRIGQVFRTLRAALKEDETKAAGKVNAHVARQAKLHRDHYIALVQFHLQSDYKR